VGAILEGVSVETAKRRDAETQRLDGITHRIIGACMEVHKAVGPGLLESAYEALVVVALRAAGLKVSRRITLPVEFMGTKIDAGYRIDLLIEDCVILELKAVEKLLPVHHAQLLTYLRLSRLSVGLLINFNAPVLKDGLHRVVNGFPDSSASRRLGVEPFEADAPIASPDDAVQRAIPHRPPFLFVDRIVEQGEGRIVTERTYRADEAFFAGHYPGSPLTPGVLLCEACFQTGAILLMGAAKTGQSPSGQSPCSRVFRMRNSRTRSCLAKPAALKSCSTRRWATPI
jgi:GxxExxY protein